MTQFLCNYIAEQGLTRNSVPLVGAVLVVVLFLAFVLCGLVFFPACRCSLAIQIGVSDPAPATCMTLRPGFSTLHQYNLTVKPLCLD